MNLSFENISAEQIKTSQIIAFALGLGISLFFGIMLFFYFYNYSQIQYTANNKSTFEILMYICLAVFLLTITLSIYQPISIVKKQFNKFKNSELSKENVDELVGIHRTYLIIRLALLEGSALFGLVVFFLSVQSFEIYSFPVYWICTIPAFVMILFVVILFPTRTKLSYFIVENLQN